MLLTHLWSTVYYEPADATTHRTLIPSEGKNKELGPYPMENGLSGCEQLWQNETQHRPAQHE